jgi:hypothetical protein
VAMKPATGDASESSRTPPIIADHGERHAPADGSRPYLRPPPDPSHGGSETPLTKGTGEPYGIVITPWISSLKLDLADASSSSLFRPDLMRKEAVAHVYRELTLTAGPPSRIASGCALVKRDLRAGAHAAMLLH